MFDTLPPLPPSPPGPPAPPATRLTVLGGPEDGLVLTCHPGDWIGRGAPADGPDHALYATSYLVDAHLHRRHLRWMEPGVIELVDQATVEGPGGARPVKAGVFELRVSEVVVVTPATRLLGLP